jgi:hypothetical protein
VRQESQPSPLNIIVHHAGDWSYGFCRPCGARAETGLSRQLQQTRRELAVVARDNDRDDNGKGGDPPVPNDAAASGGGDDDNASTRMRSGGGRPTEEGGGIIARMTTTRRRGGTSSSERRRLWIRTRPQSRRVRRRGGMGRGRRGWWRCRAGDRGRASTSAIVVAVSFVDIGHRRGRQHGLSWPSQVSTLAVVDVGHRCSRRRVAYYGKKGRHESNH